MTTQSSVLEVQIRDKAGTGAARATRRAGFVPGILYGDNQKPVSIALDPKLLNRELQHSGFFSKLFQMKVGSKTERVIARSVQFHPVTDMPLHIDFMRVGRDKKVHVSVPVVFADQEKAPGLKQGGVLNILLHELELMCDPDYIPEQIVISLEGKELHTSIHIEDIQLPKGAKPVIHGTESTIATIASPTVETEPTGEGSGTSA